MSERVLYEWRFAGYVCRIVETEPGIVHFEQAQGPPIGREQIGPLAFNRTEKPLGCANEIIHLSQALAEANVINRDLSAAVQRWQEDRNRRERGETTAWLIEMKDYVHPVPAWWGGSRYGWRHDANEAVRFCRQADADRVIESMPWKHNAIATQHSWIPPMPKVEESK